MNIKSGEQHGIHEPQHLRNLYGCAGRNDTERMVFFVDDMIAPSIQLLNRKGYTTEWCCAGHSSIAYFDGKYKCEEFFSRQLYVSFATAVSTFPPLPDGFYTTEFKGRFAIRYDYPEKITDAYAFMAKALEINRRFYDWVCLLPDCVGAAHPPASF